MARRTKEEAQETRNGILDTAERVFLKKGVSRTSLDDVAEAAGVTRGAIYWHFKNKADLFEAMMERITLPMEEMVEREGSDASEDPLVALRACALSMLVSLATDPQRQRVSEICFYKIEYVDEMEQLRVRQIECRSDCLEQIEQELRKAAKKGLLAPGVDSRLAAVGLHALIGGLMMNWVLDPKYLPLAKAAGPLIDIYIDALKCDGSEKRRTATAR